MRRYYYIDSSGEDTNLQLYSLKQAKLQWASLESDLVEGGDQVEHFHDRCVFVICTIGLSVSQLLGQNNPEPSQRVPSPSKIFDLLVDKYRLDAGLKDRFKEFMDTYDQCRHFGLTSDGSRHWQVSQITLTETRRLYEFGLLVWDLIVGIYRRDPENLLDELDLGNIEHEL